MSKKELLKWVFENVGRMTAPGCEVIVGNYKPETDLRELAGFPNLGKAKEVMRKKGLKEEDCIILYSTKEPTPGKFIP